MKYKLGILSTHPIQYFSPWYKMLAAHPDLELKVYYAHRQTPQGQSAAGFQVSFEWDQNLLEGYSYEFLKNGARHPSPDHFWGCRTPQIASIIEREKFDAFLVSGWHTWSFWQAIRACWKTKTPVWIRGDSQLLTQRSWLKRALKTPFYRWFIPRFDAYLVVGRRAKEYLRRYGAAESKMVSVPHTVDNAFFATQAEDAHRHRKDARQAWGIPPNAIVYLFVGKFLPRKRPMDFLKALSQASTHSPQVFGLLVGDGPLRPSLESFIQTHEVPAKMVGFLNQSALPKAYGASDALVLPSDGSETWGLVVNEAMASGLPAFVSDHVGCGPDLILPGMTGETFPLSQTMILAKLFEKWAAQPDALQTMGQAARRHIDNYSLTKAVDGILEAMHKSRSVDS